MRFKDKVAIVTGSAQGIGKRIAERLAAEGASVVISDIDAEGARNTALEIERVYHTKTLCQVSDLSQLKDIRSSIDFVVAEFEQVDMLVNNAGICYQTGLESISETEWDRVLSINLKAVFFCCQAMMAYLKKQTNGSILNIASLAGKVGGQAAGAHYAASKAGVICLTKVFAKELAQFNVSVNALAPGFVDTALTQAFPSEALKSYALNCPMGRLATSEDIASAALFLLSDEARYITGEILDVNGGILMD